MSDSDNSLDHSSSFDSTNSFYSTTDSSSNSTLSNFGISTIEDEAIFDAKYQGQVAEKVQLVLTEIGRNDRFQGVLDLPTVRLEASSNPATPFCFRTTATFAENSAAAAFALFAAVPRRSQWDAMCQSIQVLKTVDPLTFIYHLKLKATWPTTPRDSLMIAAFRKLQDGRLISVAWSIFDDSLCPPDPSGAFIRMQTRISANLFTPTSPTTFTLSQLIDTDPKGSIPSYLVKKISSQSFPATIESIKQAINEDDATFYHQIVQGEINPKTPSVNETTSLLMEIQARLHRIENHLIPIQIHQQNNNNNNNNNHTKNFFKYAPMLISSVSLLFLLNMNFRKNK